MSPLRPRSGLLSSRLSAVLLLLLLGSAEAFPGAEEAGAGIIGGLANACAEGIRSAIERTAIGAYNSSVQEATSGSPGPQESGYRSCRGQMLQSQEMLQRLRQIQEQLTSLQAAPEECPAGWSRHLDSCYFIPQTVSTWRLAHHGCALLDRRARLASVHPASSQFIEALLETSSAATAVWLGLSQLPEDNGWVWSDASPLDYTHWASDQPNDASHHCVASGWPGYPKTEWFDIPCTKVINSLCQINLL